MPKFLCEVVCHNNYVLYACNAQYFVIMLLNLNVLNVEKRIYKGALVLLYFYITLLYFYVFVARWSILENFFQALVIITVAFFGIPTEQYYEI